MIGHGLLSYKYAVAAGSHALPQTQRQIVRDLYAISLRDRGLYRDELRLRRRWRPKRLDSSAPSLYRVRQLLSALHLYGRRDRRFTLYNQVTRTMAFRHGDPYEQMIIEAENFRFSVTERHEWNFEYWTGLSERRWRERVQRYAQRAQQALDKSYDPRAAAMIQRTLALLDGMTDPVAVDTYRETDSILGIVNGSRDHARYLIQCGKVQQAHEVLEQSAHVSKVIGDAPRRCKAFTILAQIGTSTGTKRRFQDRAETVMRQVQWSTDVVKEFKRRWAEIA